MLNILNAEKELLVGMLDALTVEKEALIKNNVEELQRATASKEEIKRKLDNLEKVRMEKWGSNRLSELIPLMDGYEREEAVKIKKDMENMVFGIQELNNTNRMLLRQSLNYVRTIVNILSPADVTIYNPSGRAQNTITSSGLLNKSV